MEELLARVKVRLRMEGVVEDSMLTDHLLSALDVINELRQYIPTVDIVVEPQYKGVAVDMAIATYNKMGAEGQTGHTENGINRYYGSSAYPIDLLTRIQPRPRF